MLVPTNICDVVTDERPSFEVLTVKEIRERYRLAGIQAEPVDFDERDVPASLRHLIPLARVFGIGDDVLRDDLVEAADPAAIKELKRLLRAADDDLNTWLTSPAELRNPSAAYLAFSNLRMAADFA